VPIALEMPKHSTFCALLATEEGLELKEKVQLGPVIGHPLPAQGSLAPHTLLSVTSSKRCRFVI